jgi:hypothetical protein
MGANKAQGARRALGSRQAVTSDQWQILGTCLVSSPSRSRLGPWGHQLMADTAQPSPTSGLASLGDVSLERLESELPLVYDGQAPLSELLSRVVQTIYTELSEMAET